MPINGARFEHFIQNYPCRVRGISLSLLAARIIRRFAEVRVIGLAAEMTYFILLALFPLTGAVGASLGFLERLTGPEEALKAEAALIRGLEVVFSAEATTAVIAPLVQGLLRQERAGLALGGFLVSLLLFSGIFRSAIETLDTAYQVEERRGFLALLVLGLLLALCAIATATIIFGMVVVGPLLGGGRAIAQWFGLGLAFEAVWAIARWPFVFAVAIGFLALLYRTGPNVKRNTLAESLPGAVFGMTALIIVAIGFRGYIQATGLQSPRIEDADDAVILSLQVIGALVAALLWIWLSSMAVLTGGIVNAELRRIRRELMLRRKQPR